jgi:hypothetical protein
MDIRNKWIISVGNTIDQVADLIKVIDDITELGPVQQNWFFSLLDRLYVDSARLQEAVANTAALRRSYGTLAPGSDDLLHTPNP